MPIPLLPQNLFRPAPLWFDADVRFLDQIIEATEKADLFALIGTSGNVHPAAGLMELARECGAATVEINLEPSAVASAADRVILGRATEMVPTWVREVLKKGSLITAVRGSDLASSERRRLLQCALRRATRTGSRISRPGSGAGTRNWTE